MKKKFVLFFYTSILVMNLFAEEFVLRMVQIETTPIADVTKVNKIEMLEHEVTLSLYEAVMEEKPENFEKANKNLAKNMLGSFGIKTKNEKKYYYQESGIHDNHPVVGVSFYDAIYFCNKLSVIKGLVPVYSVDGKLDVEEWDYIPHTGKIISGKISQNKYSNGYRLPMQIEWLYAAKGKKNLYPESDSIEDIAWYKENSEKSTHEIAQKKPNDFGLYDMLGNVEEWTFRTNFDKSIVLENKEKKKELDKQVEDGLIASYMFIEKDPLRTTVDGESFRSSASKYKNILYSKKLVDCNSQDIDRGFRIVRSIIE